MTTTLKRKLLEKQRVQNCFASYEKYIGHFFFYNVNATVNIQIGKFFTGLFVGFVTQLCSPSNVCVCSVDTRVYTQSSVSLFTTLGTAVLSSLH